MTKRTITIELTLINQRCDGVYRYMCTHSDKYSDDDHEPLKLVSLVFSTEPLHKPGKRRIEILSLDTALQAIAKRRFQTLL